MQTFSKLWAILKFYSGQGSKRYYPYTCTTSSSTFVKLRTHEMEKAVANAHPHIANKINVINNLIFNKVNQ